MPRCSFVDQNGLQSLIPSNSNVALFRVPVGLPPGFPLMPF
jgi:hypothetical protein